MILFIVLLRRFIYIGEIQTGKVDLIGRIYQIMIVNTLNNWSYKYYSHYFIKFIGFILIYYTVNPNNVSSCMPFSYLYFGFIESIILIFFSKKKICYVD